MNLKIMDSTAQKYSIGSFYFFKLILCFRKVLEECKQKGFLLMFFISRGQFENGHPRNETVYLCAASKMLFVQSELEVSFDG